MLVMPAEEPCKMSLMGIGSVLKHETRVLHALQQHLQHQNIALHELESEEEHGNVVLIFHRRKPRLPQDEIQAILASAQGKLGQTGMLLCCWLCAK